MPDHVRMCVAVPPECVVSSVIGYIKGTSAAAIARQFGGRGLRLTRYHRESNKVLDASPGRAYIALLCLPQS